jgi:hypothetical protein
MYVSVAIGKLGPWTDFWGNAQRTYPFMTKQVILEGIGSSEDKLQDSLDKASKPTMGSMKQLQHMQRTLDDLQCGGCQENDTASPKEYQKAIREIFTPGVLEKSVVELDDYTTGGLFTARTEGNQVHAAAILSREIFLGFLNTVEPRLAHMKIFRSFQLLIEDYNKTHPEDLITLDELTGRRLKSS